MGIAIFVQLLREVDLPWTKLVWQACYLVSDLQWCGDSIESYQAVKKGKIDISILMSKMIDLLFLLGNFAPWMALEK